MVEHVGSVAIVAIDDQQRVLQIRQYRHPAGHYLRELPAGLCDKPGEPPIGAAQRELAEEAQLRAAAWCTLADLRPSPGISTEICRVYQAEQLHAEEQAAARPDRVRPPGEHPAAVPREVLADLLWPERLPDAWRRDLAAVVSKLRALLARLGLYATTALRGGGDSYQLVMSPRPDVDADAAVAWLAEAESALRRGDLGGALQAAQATAEVARRPFLAGEASDWVAQRQNALDGVLLAALEVIAEAAELAVAVRAAQEASALRPLRETSHLKLIRAHLRAGDRAEALGAYARCRQLLAEELGVDPSPALQAVYLEALREPEQRQGAVRLPLPALVSPAGKGVFAGRRAELARLNDLLGQVAQAGSGPRLAYVCGGSGHRQDPPCCRVRPGRLPGGGGCAGRPL